jgi:hypothetical protein
LATSRLFEEFSKYVPSNDELGTGAAKVVARQYGRTRAKIKKRFSTLVRETEREIYRNYVRYAEPAGDKVLRRHLRGHGTKGLFRTLNSFFLSVSQSRKSRAGYAFEGIIKGLFKQLGYAFDEHRTINGTPDFVMPSEKHFRKHAVDCIVFTAKRTLRERWRQIVTEGTQGATFFLATIDERITAPELKNILNKKIYLVVPKQLLDENPSYKRSPNVVSFEDFFAEHLDPAVKRWKRRGII